MELKYIREPCFWRNMENGKFEKKILPYDEIMTKFCIAYILVRPSDRAHAGWRHCFWLHKLKREGSTDTYIFWTLLCKTIVRILRHSLQSVGCRMGGRDHWSLYVSFGWEVTMKSNALFEVLSRLSIGEEFVKLTLPTNTAVSAHCNPLVKSAIQHPLKFAMRKWVGPWVNFKYQ